MSLITFLKRLIKGDADFSRFIEAEKGSDTRYCTLVMRRPETGRKYLRVNEGSVVQGQFIFEKETGSISIGKNTFIGGGQFICIEGIEIGNDVLISWDCTFIDNDAHSLDWNLRKNDVKDWKRGLDENKIGAYKNWEHINGKKIVIGDKVWIGFKVIILKGVQVGEGAVIGAGSVVTSDVPPFSVVAGNPAKIIKSLQ